MEENTVIQATEPKETPIYTARFQLTPNAYTQLNFIVQQRTLKKRRLTTIALAFAFTLLYGLLSAIPLPTLLLLLGTEALVIVPISTLMDRQMLGYYARRSEKMSPAALTEQHFAFYENRFCHISSGTESTLAYPQLKSIARTQDYLALFLDERNAYLVLGDAAGCGTDALAAFLQQKTGLPLEIYLQKKKK